VAIHKVAYIFSELLVAHAKQFGTIEERIVETIIDVVSE